MREEPYAIDQWRADAESGRLIESFACGTAAVVTPIGQVAGPDYALHDRQRRPGPDHAALPATQLVAIQRGRAPDPHGWVHRLD